MFSDILALTFPPEGTQQKVLDYLEISIDSLGINSANLVISLTFFSFVIGQIDLYSGTAHQRFTKSLFGDYKHNTNS